MIAIHPVGLVIGSSIYHIGVQIASYRQNQELQVLSQAMYQARELAMSRMEEEADALGADGIVGVASHFCSREFAAMQAAMEQGRVAEAARIHLSLVPLFKALCATTSPIAVKLIELIVLDLVFHRGIVDGKHRNKVLRIFRRDHHGLGRVHSGSMRASR